MQYLPCKFLGKPNTFLYRSFKIAQDVAKHENENMPGYKIYINE